MKHWPMDWFNKRGEDTPRQAAAPMREEDFEPIAYRDELPEQYAEFRRKQALEPRPYPRDRASSDRPAPEE